MFTGSLTPTQLEGLFNIIKDYQTDEPKFMKHKDLLCNIELTWFQCMCIEHALISKGTLCSLGTGLGKTASSAGYILRELEANPDSIALFFCLPESLEQIQKDYEDYLGREVPAFTGESGSLQYLSFLHDSRYPVLIFSTQALYSIEFANWFVRMSSKICCGVFDEAHMLSQESLINNIVTQICRKLPSKLFLTATPITVSPEQVITLMNMLDPYFIPLGKAMLKPYEIRDPDTFEVIDYRQLDEISTSIYPRYISWTRKELGLQGEYVPHVLFVTPTEEQINCGYNDIEEIIKGQKDSNQTKVIRAICKDMKDLNKRGLIYCNTRKNSEMLCKILREDGINVFVANGDPTNKKFRMAVLQLFKDKTIDVVITNLTTSLNLDCDYLVFWENTNKAIQMIGRCERGFVVKRLDIFIILTEDTVEVAQFSKNVYRRCKWLFEALGKDTEVFLHMQEVIDRYEKSKREVNLWSIN